MTEKETTPIIEKDRRKILYSLIILFVIFSFFFFARPKQTEAFWWSTVATDVNTGVTAGATTTDAGSTVLNTSISIKNLAKDVLKEIAKSLARRALAEMTKSTVNWINSGFHGAPLFLERPDSFFKDIAKSEIKNYVDTFGYNRLRFPFGRQAALNAISSYKSQLETNTQYTLSKVISDENFLQNYRNDFNVGGWNGFLVNTQYPQNNPMGFRLLASEELARRVNGTIQKPAEKIKTALDQGMGFLSPKNCPSNPSYNNLKNEFKQPQWNEAEYRKNNKYDPPYGGELEGRTQEEIDEIDAYNEQWDADMWWAKEDWKEQNDCPGGLVATTPGSVVASSINKALSGPQDLAIGGVNYGNSLSAIFDALLNKFIGDGLNKLATSINSPAEDEDDWDYEGRTLGTVIPYDSTSASDWINTPDEPIVLSEFKEDVARGITNTGVELTLMDNDNTERPGTIQIVNQIWPKIRELDICQPGPDLGWESRLEKEADRNAIRLQGKINDGNGNVAANAQEAYNELKFAVKFFGDWIKNKMIAELPTAIVYMDAVDEIEDLHQQSDELTKKRRAKTQAFLRLKAIQAALEQFADQPEPGSTEERSLIALRKQYNATKVSISNASSIEDARNELETSKAQLGRLEELGSQCAVEKAGKGWESPSITSRSTLNGESEQKIFCSDPIKGGYSHQMFVNPLPPTHPEIPLVNARDVLKWRGFWGLFGHTAHIEISCNTVYKANILDYKKNIPGPTNIQEEYIEPDIEFPGGGLCEESGNMHGSKLRSAMDAVLEMNPSIAESTNTESNSRAFLSLVATELQERGLNATTEVLNGNNNPNTGDLIAIWKGNATTMERYDAIIRAGAGDRSLRSAATADQFAGFVPLNCTLSGGGRECGCQDDTGGGGGGANICTDPQANNYGGALPCTYTTTPGIPTITSITPTSASPGVTTITINGSELTSTVQFYDGSGGRTTVVGSVNSAKTQTIVLVPAGLPIGNATVKIYKDASTVSNGKLIQITSGGGSGTVAPSYDTTAGFFGSLAYNSTANNYLVVSASTAINGRIMGNDGAAVTNEFKINTASDVGVMSPKVAYAPNLNKYLVVWIGWPASTGTIYGRFVNANGTPSGNAFVIFTDSAGGASYFSKNSILQYDSKNKQFVFVWEYRHSGIIDSNMITISETGTPGTAVDIGTSGGSWSPVMTVNTDANEYCLAYVRDDGITNVARRYNVATKTLGSETSLNNDSLGTTGIVYNSVNKKYMITWPSKSTATTKGKILNNCNINDGGSVLTLSSTGRGASIAHNSKSNQYAVIVQNQNNEKNGYSILSSTGSQVKSGDVFSGGNGNFSPVIAANTIDGTFGAISSREYALTRFAPGLGIKTTTASTGMTSPIIVTDGSQQSMAFNSNNNTWMVISSLDNLHSRSVGTNGSLLTGKNVINSNSGGPKIAFAKDLNKYLVIWGEDVSASSTITYGRFLSPGNTNDGGKFEIDRGKILGSSFNNNDRLQYDSKNKKFVISYRDNDQGIILLTVGADKIVTKTVIAQDTANESFFLGQVAVNEDKNEYCVNMFSAPPGGSRTQVLRSVNAANKSLSVPSKSAKGDGGFITYNTVNKEYFTLYNDGDAYGQALGTTCSFANAKTPFKIQKYARAIAFNPKSNTYAVIGEGSASLSDNPVTIFDHSGKILKRVSPFISMTFSEGAHNPMIEANTSDGSFAAITSKDYTSTVFVGNIKQ